MLARLVLLAAMALAVFAYWAGLSGPFIFDDLPNLSPVESWLKGEISWQSVMFGNQSGMMGRPLSMASFLLSAELGGHTPFAYKFGNLIVHLLCGFIGWQVVRRLLAEDPRLAARADLLASVVVALWLLHPINASTVLYSVQRMAQLSTLFVLLSLWTYLIARRQLIEGKLAAALPSLFVLFPVFMLAGLMSKENAAVAPALCLVIELAYFLARAEHKRIRQAFFAAFLVLPLLAAAGAFLFAPSKLLVSYSERDFTLIERLMTQPRVLMDYIFTILIPRTPLMGLYTDDFVPSRGLFAPVTTAISILALLVISALAVKLRKRAPSFFAGWFFFLVAHGIESSIIPLELYFEHRNYLPALGLILAVVGLVALLPQELPLNIFTPKQLGTLIVGGFALSFLFATAGRANVWAAPDTMLEQGLKHHPGSMRAQLERATMALQQHANPQGAYDAFADLLSGSNPRYRVVGRISWVTLDCMTGKTVTSTDLQRAVSQAQPSLSMAEVPALRLLTRFSRERGCGQLTDSMIADGIVTMLDRASNQPDQSRAKWLTRFLAAETLLRAGRSEDAQKQAELAWKASGDLPAGVLLSQIYASRKMKAEAQQLVGMLEKRIKPYDKQGLAELAKTRTLLQQQ
ncbi:hypothetical protein IEQ11_19550 [Lysobacter capsici]|uniref:hypothetical protein n=1 Tax=Lysobacter capsici TaxID=435897 RepID=UPI00177EFA15|nr:hypothetical protein [Lysobacter capsici]UOF13906.1 hypothetical protein IEQ11_19550 [Lysobacter capsici]